MNFRHELSIGLQALIAMIIAAVLMAACGGDSSTITSGGGGTLSQSTSRKGNGALILPPTTTGNTVPIVIDAGPVSGAREINIAYVSVTVCTPGTTTANCQTIDHVQLDTGSSGLRLLNSALYSNLNLPAVPNSGGAIGECMAFVMGATWGSVLTADIYLGGEVATSVPIQVIGDQPGGATAIPGDCSNTGTIQNTQSSLGANGILGVGLFVNDCDACLSQIIPGTYYTCTATGCTGSTVTAAQVVKNPVASFSKDNNGVLIKLPLVLDVGASYPYANGSLIFGIGTQMNNALNNTTVVYKTDPYGNFSTTYKGGAPLISYIDSGSNALFFNDGNIPTCSFVTWAYCPAPSPMPLSAINTAFGSVSGVSVTFSIVDLGSSVVAANIGGPYGQNGWFDWGLPFFFGRPVYTAISGKNTPGGPGPYFAY